MENKYLNEAIIGNKKMLATFTQKGEMQRMYFPSKDNKQYINFFHTGVKVNESDLIYLHDDINNIYKQYYDTDTNILSTEITNTYFNLKILQTDYCLIKENVLAKKYIFINEGKIDLNTQFYIHSESLSDSNNSVATKNGKSVGTTEFAHNDRPFFIAGRLLLEKSNRLDPKAKNTSAKIFLFIFNTKKWHFENI